VFAPPLQAPSFITLLDAVDPMRVVPAAQKAARGPRVA
jgi:hypothetical protein